MTKITLRAKSDPSVEITGELISSLTDCWEVQLALGVTANAFDRVEWERIYELPTTPGTVFRATVRGVGDTRLITYRRFGEGMYRGVARSGGYYTVLREHIDASTVKIELEGWE